MRRLLLLCLPVCLLLALAGTARADEPRAQFRLDGGEPHVDVPFHLDLLVEGFDESPAPAQPDLKLPDATVTPLGATPNVARSIQIINGRRSDFTRVTWQLRWRVEVKKPGVLRVPATTVVQGGKRATAPAGEVEVRTVPLAPDMKVALELPERPVFVGESVPVTLTWLFRRQPQSQSFSVPLLASDTFTASAPTITDQRRTLSIAAGTKELTLPYTLDEVEVGGARYNRLALKLFVAPKTPGRVEVAPSSVVAALAVGRPDFFGDAPTRLFRAVDTARSLEVKPLPQANRPPTFAGAVGEQFSIEVRTSRSVVSLGEPVELDVTIRSNQPLDTLSLGKLDGEGRLPADRFTVPAEPPTGELSDDGKTKTFKIVAQVTGPATEIPALAFSYFDPTRGTYQTIHSEPIALSVKGGSFVGASDVVSATPGKRTQAPSAPDDTALVNAELALSSLGAVHDRPLGGTLLWILVGVLYLVPLAILAGRSWQVRTRGQREEAAEVRLARKKVEELLARAATEPARDVAGPLGAAMRELGRTLGRGADDGGVLAKLETEAFAPGASSQPLSSELRAAAEALVRRWLGEPRKGAPRKAASAVAVLLVALVAPHAEAGPLEDGRAAYAQAMELASDPSARKAAFARAAVALGEAARATPDRPELLTDWGNAALGAGDVATATLAYRRALAIDGSNARARHNLAWLRSRQADAFRPTYVAGATDALLFFHPWPTARKLLVGAGAFAIAILLLVPWTGRRRRGLAALAIVPLAVWAAMLASVALADRHGADAIVMDDVVMRAADSAGAPAALSQPVPRGAEVEILERREAWTRIRIASGTTGWVPEGAVERIAGT